MATHTSIWGQEWIMDDKQISDKPCVILQTLDSDRSPENEYLVLEVTKKFTQFIVVFR